MLTNHHTHCEFCDGKITARAMADAARDAGFSILGFSSHAPLPFGTDWNMDGSRLEAYLAEIRSLAVEHGLPRAGKPAMTILVGLEIDYIDGLCGPADGRFKKAGLDYSIGSVHYVSPAGPPTVGFTVDEPEEDFAAHLRSFYDGDADALVEDYFAAVAACVKAGGFDILGHIDLIRKNNRGQSRFREDTERYRAAAMQAVDALVGTDIIVEVNTGGMARGKTDSPYPALWIAKELKSRGIPVCVNADAHHSSHLLANRDDGLRLAREAGYHTLTIVGKDGRRELPVD